MDRLCHRSWPIVGLLLIVGLSLGAGTGCRALFSTVAYLIRGTDVEADYKGLEGKKVVVVCRPLANLTFSNANVGPELAREVGIALRTKGSKIHVIDHQKVAEWTDEHHNWHDFTEVGKALKADKVVGLDLTEFSLMQGQTLMQGSASVQITVHDCKTGKQDYEKALDAVKYPPNSAIPMSGQNEGKFRREYIRVLADHIGRHFYAHDRYAEFGREGDTSSFD